MCIPWDLEYRWITLPYHSIFRFKKKKLPALVKSKLQLLSNCFSLHKVWRHLRGVSCRRTWASALRRHELSCVQSKKWSCCFSEINQTCLHSRAIGIHNSFIFDRMKWVMFTSSIVSNEFRRRKKRSARLVSTGLSSLLVFRRQSFWYFVFLV